MLRPAVRSSVWRIRGYICPTCRITPVVPPAHRVRVYTHDALTSRLDSDAAPHASLNGSPAEPKEGARANVGTAESNSESPIGSTATQAPQSHPDRTAQPKNLANRVRSNKEEPRDVPTAESKGEDSVPETKAQKKKSVKKKSVKTKNVEKASLDRAVKAKEPAAVAAAARENSGLVRKAGKKTKDAGGEKGKHANGTGGEEEEGKETEKPSSDSVTPVQRSTTVLHTDSLDPASSEITALNTESTKVPKLSYGLDRVLFNPGIYHLQDPRSKVYNFDPYLKTIMPVSEFDFDALKDYITSSRDETLFRLAKENNRKYVGSSSSMTSVLSHFHFLLSNWRELDTSMLSRSFGEYSSNFTRTMRAPSAVFLRYKDGAYAIDADKEHDSTSVLLNLGKSMEKLLTMSSDEFERYRKSSENKRMPEEAEDETYHYTVCGDFLMRGQLDAYDARLPGTGMFDLKTRAVVSIRMDAGNPENGMGYQIKDRQGNLESYEKEYYDMIRAAFLKYSLQVRIGRMDGIFVAYHNAERIFGFQYVALPEMDQAIHGQEDTFLGDAEFKLSVSLWNKVLNQATAEFPEQSLRFHFETRDAQVPFMYIFAEPVTEEEIDDIQSKNAEQFEKEQRKLLFPESVESEESEDSDVSATETENEQSASSTQETEMHSSTELESGVSDNSDVSATETENEQSASSTQEAEVHSSAEPESGISDDSDISTVETETAQSELENQGEGESTLGLDGESDELSSILNDVDGKEESRPILAMALSVQNLVNDSEVDRPQNLKATDSWKVQYRLSSFNQKRGRDLYEACKRRRKKVFVASDESKSRDAYLMNYRLRLKNVSAAGRKWREEQDMEERERGIITLSD